MDRTALYREQAGYCADLLTRTRDPTRRALIEQEHHDWLLLARQCAWAGSPGEPRSFAAKGDRPR